MQQAITDKAGPRECLQKTVVPYPSGGAAGGLSQRRHAVLSARRGWPANVHGFWTVGVRPAFMSASVAVGPRRRLARPALVGVCGVLFAVLLLLVRGRWAPLESVDHGLATDLNRAVADNHVLVAGLRLVTRLGSFGV